MAQLAAQEHFFRTMLDVLYALLTFALFGMVLLFEYLVRRSPNQSAMQPLGAKLPKLALGLIGWSLLATISSLFPGIAWLRVIDGIVGCAGIVAGLMLHRRLKAAAAR